ncbi:hypothetical protein BsWGS_04709 [Bradybaena similaris]
MMDTQLTKRLKNAAANVLRETWLIYRYTKLVKKVNISKVRKHQRKFLQSIHSLRRVKMDQRKLTENQSTLVDMAKIQTNIHDLVLEMHSNQNVMEKQVFKMEAKLTQLQMDIENLPDLVAKSLGRSSGQRRKEFSEMRIPSVKSDIIVPKMSTTHPRQRRPFQQQSSLVEMPINSRMFSSAEEENIIYDMQAADEDSVT